jgi:uncharacterized protein with von Willebrand factor type A (vWA) domain
VTRGLVERTVEFCRELRGRGLLVTTSHAADAVEALRQVGIARPDRVYLALRCVLASRPEDFATFDELFRAAFQGEADLPPQRRAAQPRKTSQTAKDTGQVSLERWLRRGEQGDGGGDPEEVPGASERAALARKDFSSLGVDELSQIERLAARIARRLAARPSRRWAAARRGRRIDLRRTARRSISNGGEPVELRFRRRKPRKTRIVALCDVSGSMDLYSRFLLRFLYALQGTVARVESFVFSTALLRVTEALRERPLSSALRGLSERAHDWSGGTRIGACLSTFNAEWGRLVDRRTVVVILSDGWDTGDPAELAGELEVLKMRCRKLIWLNPLLGSAGYEPLTAGMQAALPYLSVFAPAHDLDSLRALERHLLS